MIKYLFYGFMKFLTTNINKHVLTVSCFLLVILSGIFIPYWSGVLFDSILFQNISNSIIVWFSGVIFLLIVGLVGIFLYHVSIMFIDLFQIIYKEIYSWF